MAGAGNISGTRNSGYVGRAEHQACTGYRGWWGTGGTTVLGTVGEVPRRYPGGFRDTGRYRYREYRARAGRDRLPSGRDGAVLGGVDTCEEGSGGDRTHLRLRGGSARSLRHQPAPAMGRRAGCSLPLCLLLLLLQVSHGMGRQDPAEPLPGAAGPCSGPCPVLTNLSGQSGQRLCQRAAPCQPGFAAETFTLTVPRDSVAAGRALGRGKDAGTTGWL